jgi:hypothetical protein
MSAEEQDEARGRGEQIIHVIHHFDPLKVDLVVDTVDIAVGPVNVNVNVVTPAPVPVAIKLVPGVPVHN